MYHKAAFAIDMEPLFVGWSNDAKWNGWACPAFELDVAKLLMEYVNKTAPDACKITFDPVAEIFNVPMEDSNEPAESQGASLIDVTGNGPTVKVWHIGGWGWCWEEHQIYGL